MKLVHISTFIRIHMTYLNVITWTSAFGNAKKSPNDRGFEIFIKLIHMTDFKVITWTNKCIGECSEINQWPWILIFDKTFKECYLLYSATFWFLLRKTFESIDINL